MNYILHRGAVRFYALLKGALTEKSLRNTALYIGYTHVMLISCREFDLLLVSHD